MIDPVINWSEIANLGPKDISNGGKCKSLFQELCENMDIKSKPGTDYNPQSNAIDTRLFLISVAFLLR